MATYTTTGKTLGSPVTITPETWYADKLSSYYHKNDDVKSTHYVGNSQLAPENYIYPQNFLAVDNARHQTLLSTLYSGQDKYIIDVSYIIGPNGENIIKTLSNANDADHFVFVRDDQGMTYTAVTEAPNTYVVETQVPITPKEVYAATPSRTLYITDADNFTPAHVFSGTYTFGSVCDTSQLQAQLNQCLADKAQLQAQLNQCQSDLSTCQNDLSTCQGDLSTCQNDLSTCQGDLSTCQGNLSTCQTNLNTCQNDLSTCNTNLTTCQNDLNTCNTNLSTCQNDLNTCQTDLSNCQTTVANQQTTINNLQNQIISLQNQIASLNAQIASLQAALAACQASNNPIVSVLSHTITEKHGGILVQLTTEYDADVYLFLKEKETGEIVKVVQSPFTGTTHTVFIPVKSPGTYVIDYLSIKHV